MPKLLGLLSGLRFGTRDRPYSNAYGQAKTRRAKPSHEACKYILRPATHSIQIA